jgi:hypothetical protein
MTDTIIHKDRPDLASDAVEVAIFGVNANVFTLVLSAEKKAAWIEIDGGDGKILIAFPIDKVAELIMNYVATERQKTGTSDVILEKSS